MESFEKVNHALAKNFYIQNLLVQKLPAEKSRNEQKYRTSSNTCLGINDIFSRRFGTGVEMRRTFHRRLAACIENTRVQSRKDCLAGYSYQKTAVINEHCVINSLHTL